MEFVKNGVPGSVELFDGVVAREGEVITAAVASRVIRVNARDAVHGLVNISEVVDEEADGN